MSIQRVLGLLVGAIYGIANPAQAASGGSCDTPSHHQFDFWIGEWDVYRPDNNQLVAHSKIEKLYAGCAVRENWMPLAGAGGGSLNSYRPKTGEWRQVWTDSANEVHEYSGRWTGTMLAMEGRSTGADDAVKRIRMTYEPRPKGNVIQTGYHWDEQAKDWALDYQFDYRRSRKP